MKKNKFDMIKTSTMDLTISILYGSVRSERQGIKAAKYLEKRVGERGIKTHLIDPLEYQLPFLDKMYKEYASGEAPAPMEELAEIFRASDGFLIVTGEYNHSIPPALKNLLDHFQREYLFKPSAIASYSAGIYGGVRAAVHLRVILGELGMPPISSMRPLPKIEDKFDENFEPKKSQIDRSTTRFLDELIWYAEALKAKREKGVPF